MSNRAYIERISNDKSSKAAAERSLEPHPIMWSSVGTTLENCAIRRFLGRNGGKHTSVRGLLRPRRRIGKRWLGDGFSEGRRSERPYGSLFSRPDRQDLAPLSPSRTTG